VTEETSLRSVLEPLRSAARERDLSYRAMNIRRRFRIRLRSRTLELGERTLVMGVLNVTPDSFSDGGRYLGAGAAVRRALEMEA